MKRDTKFKPGVSGNQTAKWGPGQSGNPAGKSKGRARFEEAFNEALITQGSAEEAAQSLWQAARGKEPWAIHGTASTADRIQVFLRQTARAFQIGPLPGSASVTACERGFPISLPSSLLQNLLSHTRGIGMNGHRILHIHRIAARQHDRHRDVGV